MKNLRARLMEITMLALLVTACIGSVGQLTARAQVSPALPPGGAACAGLACYDGSDCGTKCFCNRPSSGCFEN